MTRFLRKSILLSDKGLISWAAALAFLTITLVTQAFGQIEVVPLKNYVSDYAGVLPDNVERQLNTLLKSLQQKTLKQAMILSVPTFVRIGRHILLLKDEEQKHHAEDVIKELRRLSDLPLQGLEAAWKIKSGALKPSRREMGGFFESYLNDAVALTRYIDSLAVE